MNIENKQIRKKKLDKDTTLKVYLNESGQRIFVEFSTEDKKLFLQKSFQDTFEGRKESEAFQESIKSTKELKNYFKGEK